MHHSFKVPFPLDLLTTVGIIKGIWKAVQQPWYSNGVAARVGACPALTGQRTAAAVATVVKLVDTASCRAVTNSFVLTETAAKLQQTLRPQMELRRALRLLAASRRGGNVLCKLPERPIHPPQPPALCRCCRLSFRCSLSCRTAELLNLRSYAPLLTKAGREPEVAGDTDLRQRPQWRRLGAQTTVPPAARCTARAWPKASARLMTLGGPCQKVRAARRRAVALLALLAMYC